MKLTPQLKQRLIGCAVLAALAFIFLPFILHDSHAPAKQDAEIPIASQQEPNNLQAKIQENLGNEAVVTQAETAATQNEANQDIAANNNNENNPEPLSNQNINQAMNNPPTVENETTAPSQAENAVMQVHPMEPQNLSANPSTPVVENAAPQQPSAPVVASKDQVSAVSVDSLKVKSSPMVASKDQDAKTLDHKTVNAVQLDKKNAHEHESKKYAQIPQGEGAWVLQLGSYAKVENANNLVHSLREQGYDAYVHPAKEKKNISWVYIGPEIDMEKLKTLKSKIKARLHLNSIIKKYQA